MSDEQGKAILSTTAILAIALVVWSELHDNHRLPVPARFVGVGLVWGTLGLVAPFISYPLASAVAAGMLLALYYQHWSGKTASIQNATPPGGSGPTFGNGAPEAFGIQPPLSAPQ